MDDPERALPFTRRLVGISPYDEGLRALMIRQLVALGHLTEAEQQFRLGNRMLAEINTVSDGRLLAALRRTTPPAPPVTAEPAAPPPQPNLHGDLVGRETELARFDAVFDAVVSGSRAEVLLLRGEAGIGKTRMLERIAAMARERGALLLEASAFESESIRPFALWTDALRALPESTASDVFSGAGHDNRERLLAGLSDLVADASATGPVVVAFDDAHWCDESSAAALHYVARTNRQRPLLAVVAVRESEQHDNAALQQALRGLRHEKLLQELHLGPLSEQAIEQLIQRRVPTAESARLCRECGGNPLLAIALARAGEAADGSSSLDDLVRERLARLDPERAEVFRWAAVLSPRIDVATLTRLSGIDPADAGEALEAAERQGLLQVTARGLRFAHDLVARSVYADISPARRRIMHRRIAELLEQDAATDLSRAADRAHHAAHSGDPALAARAMVSAGRLCLRFFANEDALTLAKRGLQQAEELTGAERVCLALELREIALAAAPLPDWEAAAAEYTALAEEALEHGALSHARLGYHMASYLRWAHGHWTVAREETLQAERAVRSGTIEEHVIGLAETAKCLAMLERDLSQADAMLMESQALARRERISHPAIPAALGMLRYHENRLDEAEELFKEARTLCKSAGDRLNEFQANEYLVMIEIERDRMDTAAERCAALREIGDKLREGSEAPFARALEGLCRYAGDDDTAQLEPALEELRLADAKHRLAYVLTRAALVDLERGRIDAARARAEEALDYAATLERATEILLARVALARAAADAGDERARQQHVDAINALSGASVAAPARKRAASLTGVQEHAR
jgi:hypothetical protein